VILPSIFSSPVKAGFSTRDGGVSLQPYSSLNLGLSTADTQENVTANRDIMAGRFGLTKDRLAIAGQVHGSDVETVYDPGLYRGCDGLVTNTPNLLLAISAADCACILLADPESLIIGACHAGWRGHVAGVAGQTISSMEALGATKSAIQAYISPCISMEHFEVGEEVVEQFPASFVVREPHWPKAHLDLSGSIRADLIQNGLLSAHIEQSVACTFAESTRFFSHRAQNGVTGRMMGMICISASSSQEER